MCNAKTIAFTSCVLTSLLMISACVTSDWITTDGWREGLFQQCVDEGATTPLPFGGAGGGTAGHEVLQAGCHRAHAAGYVSITAALVVVVCLTDFFGTLLTGLGLRTTDPETQYKYFRVASWSLAIATICLIVALIIYPVSFSKEIQGGPSREWSFGFGYGAGWASFILLFMSLVLLICDREAEEIFYRDRQERGEEEEEEEEEEEP